MGSTQQADIVLARSVIFLRPARANHSALSQNAEVELDIGGPLRIGHNVNVSFDADDHELNLVRAIICFADIPN